MREINFRVWSTKYKLWCGYDIRGFVFIDPKNKDQEVITWHTKEDEILMQYTGLKDKNGKEIYEYDSAKYVTAKGEYVGKIEFGDGVFYWILGTIKFYMHDMDLSKLEVIGNIYENPELVK